MSDNGTRQRARAGSRVSAQNLRSLNARPDPGQTAMPRPRKRPVVMTVVGARPQFVKIAPLSRALRRDAREILVHTGQHYDREMSDAFFAELRIPRPDVHLGVGSGSHGRMTALILERLEAAMLEKKPEVVVVIGDTNSTLAAALAAVKLQIPVAHVEAGLRSFDMRMPEEINRRIADHVSAMLLCPTVAAVRNLRAEGITKGVHLVGDVMMDAVLESLARVRRLRSPTTHPPRSFYLATIHRQENVDDEGRLRAILGALQGAPLPVILPLHPRTRERLRRLRIVPGGPIEILPPLPYLAMLRLLGDARGLLTDSGGLQKEAFIVGTPCLTMRDATEWVETLEGGANRLVGADSAKIVRGLRAIEALPRRGPASSVYGGGCASARIARLVTDFARRRRRGP